MMEDWNEVIKNVIKWWTSYFKLTRNKGAAQYQVSGGFIYMKPGTLHKILTQKQLILDLTLFLLS